MSDGALPQTPHGGAYSAPPDSLAGFKGAALRQEGNGGKKGLGDGEEGKGGERRNGEGMGKGGNWGNGGLVVGWIDAPVWGSVCPCASST